MEKNFSGMSFLRESATLSNYVKLVPIKKFFDVSDKIEKIIEVKEKVEEVNNNISNLSTETKKTIIIKKKGLTTQSIHTSANTNNPDTLFTPKN